MITNIALNHRGWCSSSITLDGEPRKVALTGTTSNVDAAICVPKMKVGFIEKDALLPTGTPVFMSTSPL